MELPECPVCLETYDGACRIPRVLACGHSTCQPCLLQLPQPFPTTIRCPACTQLVNFPNSPSSLPKNIDLLKLIPTQNPNPNPNPNPNTEFHFLPPSWTTEFYSIWKNRILSNDTVSIELRPEPGCNLMYGTFNNNQIVSLLRVGFSIKLNLGDDLVFNFSYIARIMRILNALDDRERDDLGLVFGDFRRRVRVCEVFGLWFDLGSGFLYLVCERYSGSILKLSELGDFSQGLMCNFAIIGMEMCESVISLHSEGLIMGCLGLECYEFDEYGHAFVNINAVLLAGRHVRDCIGETILGRGRIDSSKLEVICENLLKTHVFVSPEVLFEILHKEGIDAKYDSSRYSIQHSSDIWSLACVLLGILIGKPLLENMFGDLYSILLRRSEEQGFDYLGSYVDWLEKVRSLLDASLGTQFTELEDILCKCLDFDPGNRPLVSNVWKSIRGVFIKPQFDIMIRSEVAVGEENSSHCLVLSELCRVPKEIDEEFEHNENGGIDVEQVREANVDKDLVEGLSNGHIKSMDLSGHHRDCITGLAVGGGFLFSSSFDKTVQVWSLQDFAHVHSLKGHEHRVMAIIFVDEGDQYCVSGDSGGGIFVWDLKTVHHGQEPLKKWYEEKDWRYSGIHALAAPGNGYLYTGSGDKSIKVWSLQDCTLFCTMNGHKSAVSTLAICNGVLYSGSWDGTIRLWCLDDHSLLTVLEDDTHVNLTSVLSLTADRHMLVAAHENGIIKIWRNDVLKRSTQAHSGAVLALSMEGSLLFTGGWDKTVNVQELSGDEFEIDVRPLGSISCDSIITALLYWQGKLFVGYADRVIKVYHYGY